MVSEKAQLKSCFVIAAMSDDESAERRRLERLLKYIVRPAAEECGYEAFYEIQKPGLITSQIIKQLVKADLVIADLTGHNPNVLYELAIRHVSKKMTVQIIDKNEDLPFDVRDLRTIPYTLDSEDAEKAREQLVVQIREVEADPTAVDNPITVAVETLALQSDDGEPVPKWMARISEQLAELQRRPGLIGNSHIGFHVKHPDPAAPDGFEVNMREVIGDIKGLTIATLAGTLACRKCGTLLNGATKCPNCGAVNGESS